MAACGARPAASDAGGRVSGQQIARRDAGPSARISRGPEGWRLRRAREQRITFLGDQTRILTTRQFDPHTEDRYRDHAAGLVEPRLFDVALQLFPNCWG